MNQIFLLLFLIRPLSASIAQVKYIVEDFEGLAQAETNLKKTGIFSFGNAQPMIQKELTTGNGYSGNRAIKINWEGENSYGGWGKGIGMFVGLNAEEDYINFYLYSPLSNKRSDNIRIALEEDDNLNGVFEQKNDDRWHYEFIVKPQDEWQLITIPLKDFKDANKGGDGIFNSGYKAGKLFTFIIIFMDTTTIRSNQQWYFDFICFSKGKLYQGNNLFDPQAAAAEDYCMLGAWSEEGNSGNFSKIPETFEGLFRSANNKKIGVVHFFQPFSTGKDKRHYPSVNHINEILNNGYIPMITLENHFVQVNKNYKQPNLYSIVEGHFDYLFNEWSDRVKQAKGTVILRILHEFNGDWYPWCISRNDNDPQLYIRAFRHIRNIFNKRGVSNVKFIWCPNSMSIPQESWNYIMDAYPGDEYVDFVGLDVYNGAAQKGTPAWRSFRKEAIENYFLLTELLPYKPLLICETASRERRPGETGIAEDKAEWIEQMAQALTTDLSKIRLLAWFNEYDSFKINSSAGARKAFYRSVWKNEFFKTGNDDFIQHWVELKPND